MGGLLWALLRFWATITNPGQQQQQQQQQHQQHQQQQKLSLTRIRALREYVLNISRSQQLNDNESSSSQEAEAEPSAAGLVSTQRSVFEQTVAGMFSQTLWENQKRKNVNKVHVLERVFCRCCCSSFGRIAG